MPTEVHIDIYLDDLVPEKQKEVLAAYGEDFNFDEPIVELDVTIPEGGAYEEAFESKDYLDDIYRSRRHRGWRQQRHNRY